MGTLAIAIAGASCSGKTTLADALARSLSATVLRVDDYYRSLSHMTYEERCAVNFDHPETIDHEQLANDVERLISGQRVLAPRYDFTRHAPFAERVPLDPADFIVVEGLFALTYPELVAKCDVTIFVDAHENTCLDRRIARDVRERGRTPDEVVYRFRHDVWPMYIEHILPHRERAHVVVDGECLLDDGIAQVNRALASIS